MKRVLIFAVLGVLSCLIPGVLFYLLVTGFDPQNPVASRYVTYGAVIGLPAAFAAGVADWLLEKRGIDERYFVAGIVGLIVGYLTLISWASKDNDVMVISAVVGLCSGLACAVASALSRER